MTKPSAGPVIKKAIKLIERRLDELRLSAFQAARKAGLPNDSIRYILNGSSPSIDHLYDVGRVLGISFINFNMDVAQYPYLENLNKIKNYLENFAPETVPAYAYDLDIDDTEHMPVPKLEVKAATGHGATVNNE